MKRREGEAVVFCAGGESCSTIPIPQSIIIKTLTSTGGGKRGSEQKKERNGMARRAKKGRTQKGKKRGKKRRRRSGDPPLDRVKTN